mmetsp:Transcript_11333/g.21403  ORF Transcript_11333/g.21403 Transcript_11333/m.21403 type:complete len:467 (-) Transcript_11333:139-1539(-)
MDVSHQNARTVTRAIALLLSLVTLLQVLHSNGVVAVLSEAPSRTVCTSATDNTIGVEYESKIQKALFHASKARQLIDRALVQGEAAAALDMEISPDGNVAESASDSSQENLFQAEFVLQALEHELRTLLNDLGESGDGVSDDDDDDSGDDDSEDGYHSADDEKYDSGDDHDEHGDHSGEDAGDSDSGGDYDDDDDFYDVIKREYVGRDKVLKKILDAIDDRTARENAYTNIRHQALKKLTLDPDAWYEYTYWQIHAYFSCSRWFASKPSVYDSEKWADVRQHWNDFRDEDVRKDRIPEAEPERVYQFTEGEFDPPTTPFFAGGAKGRGLKASKDISEGELVFKATNNTVVFTHGHTWRKFLFSLYERNGELYDSGTACDVLVWSWVQPIEDNGPLVIVADLDNGSLLNEGREDEPGWDVPNVRCGKEGDTMCMMSYYATKHIKAGEELLCDYNEFASFDGWRDMGL